MKKKIGIITLGCKVNQYESEAFAEALTDLGYEICDASEPCDAYIVNSRCGAEWRKQPAPFGEYPAKAEKVFGHLR